MATSDDNGEARRARAALLHACLGPDPSHERVHRTAHAVGDWSSTIELARRHGVVVHLDAALRDAGVAVPTAAASSLDADRRALARRGFAALRETARLQAVLAEAGVRALPLKGPVLAIRAYADTGRRDYGDLDLLVARGDLARTRERLIADGWSPKEPVDARRERFYEQTTGQLVPLVRGGGLPLEVHGTVHEPHLAVRPEAGGLWERTSSVTFDGQTLDAMSVEDTLLTACTHAACAQWRRLEWVAAVAWLCRRDDLDWVLAERTARQTGTLRMLRLALLLADTVAVGLASPAARGVAAGDRGATSLSRGFAAAMASGEPPAGRRNELSASTWRRQLQLQERRRDRLRAVARATSTPTYVDARLVRLPRHLERLYVLVRLLRLAAGAVRKPIRRLAGR